MEEALPKLVESHITPHVPLPHAGIHVRCASLAGIHASCLAWVHAAFHAGIIHANTVAMERAGAHVLIPHAMKRACSAHAGIHATPLVGVHAAGAGAHAITHGNSQDIPSHHLVNLFFFLFPFLFLKLSLNG